ncbi:GNAT family N-acetyltransferase [Nocardioides aurantiacus]|uniref:GNAT family N-acetyltransferase n=1 Tax=Nocardioides aurantiacus TaxID=86796 RepID=UPI00403F1831
MDDLTTRPMTAADAPAVQRLLVALEAADRTEEHYSVEDVLEELENPMTGPEDWLLVERAGELVAMSRLLPRAPTGYELLVGIDGGVHPDHRRQGIGRWLFPQLVRRAEEHVAERGSFEPVISATGPSDQPGFAALVAASGLTPDRYEFLMRADLAAEPPAPRFPEGCTVSTWEGVDPEELRAAHNVAFVGHPSWSPWSAEMWAQWVSGSRALRPALSVLVRDPDGAVAAYLQTNEWDAVAEQTGRRETYVAKVGTLPDHRRRGLAGAMLLEAQRRHRADGVATVGLDVDSQNPTGALGVYEAVGFEVRRRWTTYRRR